MTELKSIPRRVASKPKPPLKCAIVKSTERITPNMQRVILTGDDVATFRPNRDGANLKICVPPATAAPDEFRAILKDNAAAKLLRTFTVRTYDPVANELVIDFALHEPAGHSPAGDWARAAQPGDLLGYRGPSDKKMTDFHATNYIMSADMTALPALAAILADMPRHAQGDAFIEITHEDDVQPLENPDGVSLHWLVHPDPSKPSTQAIKAIKALSVPDDLQIAVIGEHSVVAELKDYFFGQIGLDPLQNYASPYWKIGMVEEEHQAFKKAQD